MSPLAFDFWFVVLLCLTKEKEVFMQSADYSWKPSVGIA